MEAFGRGTFWKGLEEFVEFLQAIRWQSKSREHCEQSTRSRRTNVKWCNLAGVGHKQSDNGKCGWRARFEHYVENPECQTKAFALNSVGIYQALSTGQNSKIVLFSVLGPDVDGKFAFFPYIYISSLVLPLCHPPSPLSHSVPDEFQIFLPTPFPLAGSNICGLN